MRILIGALKHRNPARLHKRAVTILNGQARQDAVGGTQRPLPALIIHQAPALEGYHREGIGAGVVEITDRPEIEYWSFRDGDNTTKIVRIKINISAAAKIVVIQRGKIHSHDTRFVNLGRRK